MTIPPIIIWMLYHIFKPFHIPYFTGDSRSYMYYDYDPLPNRYYANLPKATRNETYLLPKSSHPVMCRVIFLPPGYQERSPSLQGEAKAKKPKQIQRGLLSGLAIHPYSSFSCIQSPHILKLSIIFISLFLVSPRS